jgi:glycerol transport system substrate-binding protein
MVEEEEYEDILRRKYSRRAAISKGAAAGAIVGVGIVAGLVGYYAGSLGAPAAVTKTQTVTVTGTAAQTVTKTQTVTVTGTAAPPTVPAGLGPEDEPYIKAAEEFIAWIGDDTVLTPSQLREEVYHFVKASKPFRGTEIINMYEALPGAVWEEQNLAKWFERITGIKVRWEAMSNYETILKSYEDAKTKTGIYDVLGTDQDMHGFYILNKSALNLSAFMRDHPDLTPPYFDVDDIWAKGTYSYKGDIYAIHGQAPWIDTMYRRSWLTDPKNKEDFKKKYGYDLKTPLEYYIEARKYKTRKTSRKSMDMTLRPP